VALSSPMRKLVASSWPDSDEGTVAVLDAARL